MYTYILVSVNDEGIQGTDVTQAASVWEAIEKGFEWAPYDPGDFFKEGEDELQEKYSDGKEEAVTEITKRMREAVRIYYNLDRDPKWRACDTYNHVEGDSRSERMIIEIRKSMVSFYPNNKEVKLCI